MIIVIHYKDETGSTVDSKSTDENNFKHEETDILDWLFTSVDHTIVISRIE